MVRIRLRRVGLRNQPSYRVVVADKEAPRDGRFLEIVGFYNPRTEPATIEFHEDRIYEWLSKGAQPSEPISRLFKVVNLMDRFKRYKAGEPVDKILADAKAFYDARVVSPRTRRDAEVVKPAKKKAKTEEAKPEAAAEGEAKPEKAPKGEAKAEAVVEAVAAPNSAPDGKVKAVETEKVVVAAAQPVEAEKVVEAAPKGASEAETMPVEAEKVVEAAAEPVVAEKVEEAAVEAVEAVEVKKAKTPKAKEKKAKS
jgi:small subunit ribosomal protein S16